MLNLDWTKAMLVADPETVNHELKQLESYHEEVFSVLTYVRKCSQLDKTEDEKESLLLQAWIASFLANNPSITHGKMKELRDTVSRKMLGRINNRIKVLRKIKAQHDIPTTLDGGHLGHNIDVDKAVVRYYTAIADGIQE